MPRSRIGSKEYQAKMKISVIISTYNSPEWLEKVFWGYRYQSFSGFEIVIADDGSTDETVDLLKSFGNETRFTVHHVRHEDDGFRKWKIVNKAIAKASGDYLIFTDGDCIPHPNLVETHATKAEPGFFLSGGYCKLPMSTSRKIRENDIRTGDAFRTAWLRKNGYGPTLKSLKLTAPGSMFEGILNRLTPAKKTFNGNNSSCFRADAVRINGFDERILYGGGDREFGYRLQHAGIEPKMIRYSTVCLHLDHERGYKSDEVRRRNLALIEESRREKRVRTEFGIA